MTPEEMRRQGREWMNGAALLGGFLSGDAAPAAPVKDANAAGMVGALWLMNAERCDRLDAIVLAIESFSLRVVAASLAPVPDSALNDGSVREGRKKAKLYVERCKRATESEPEDHSASATRSDFDYLRSSVRGAHQKIHEKLDNIMLALEKPSTEEKPIREEEWR